MKIKDLKQPYLRMINHLRPATKFNNHKTNELSDYFDIDGGYTYELRFLRSVNNGKNPEITEQIKSLFPDDFDFSGEGKTKTVGYALTPEFKQAYNRLHECTREEFFKANFKRVKEEEEHTQLAKEGKFDYLPDTCEFSEPIEMEVWNREDCKVIVSISGKFKGLYLGENKFPRNNIFTYKFAQTHTPKIDFSKFKIGNVVEVVTSHYTYYGMIEENREKSIKISMGGNSGATLIPLSGIKTINKIK